jgi:hypothetical protein
MEITGLGSGAVGALRVGIQVISNHRRPMLEFYSDLHNELGPEQFTPERTVGPPGFKFVAPESHHRRQSIYVAISVINIDGVRAENVGLSVTSTVRPDRPLPPRFGNEIAQLAPGQRLFLFRLDQYDLFKGDQSLKFSMSAEYNGPWSGLNRLFRLQSHLRRAKQYRSNFDFNADVIAGDLPSPSYA